MKFSVF